MKVDIQRKILNKAGEMLAFGPNLTRGLQNACFINAHKVVLNYMEKNFTEVIQKHKEKRKVEIQEHIISMCEPIIWVSWWQGYEQAPELVKECIDRIRMKKNNNCVVFLDKNNYMDYIKFPKSIQIAIDAGKVSLNHFADLMRVYLLAEYGGLWIDATVFITQNFEKEIFQAPLFSMPLPIEQRSLKYVSRGRWAGFLIGCNYDNRGVFEFAAEYMEEYFNRYDEIFTYFFLDYIFEIAYVNNIHDFQKNIDLLKPPTCSLYQLNEIISNDPQKLETIVLEKALTFYKLNWKAPYAKDFELIRQRIHILEGNTHTNE